MNINRAFRKYHRTFAVILCLPLLLTVLTGIAATITGEWSVNLGITHSFILKLHTGEIFHLEKIYPILNGLGLLGLLITGISMSRIFKST